MKTFLDENIDLIANREIYVAGSWKSGDDTQDVYQRVPVGLADRVVKGGEEVDLVEFGNAALTRFRNTSLRTRSVTSGWVRGS
tara:strand:+ start:127 stop:375 length:249 start_codon:yes stop_codon:yes gene_type:complete